MPPESDDIDLQARLEAAQKTISALTARVERLEGNAPDEADVMARALASMQHELEQRTAVLHETEAFYRSLYESSASPLLTVDERGVVLACNRSGIDWLERPRDEVLGASLADLLEDESAERIRLLAEAQWTGVAEQRFTLEDGRRLALSAAAIEGAGSVRYHLTVHDVTTRQVLEDARDQQRRMKALAELAGAIARELNDPMSIVQGRIELLHELGVDDPAMVRKHLRVALDHSLRISATLQNLRLVGVATPSRLDRVFLSEVIDAALDLVGGDKRPAVELHPADLAAGGDAALYARVLASLLRRVMDSAQRAAITIVAERSRDRVAVRISGGGSVRMVHEDEGAQLSIAHTLLESVGGSLETQRAGGAPAFVLFLPLPPPVRARPRPVEARLLVVGSDQLERTMDGLLGREGFELVRARDVKTALGLIEDVDAVATELFLPDVSGLTLAQEAVRLQPRLQGRVLLVADARLERVPPDVVALHPPLDRIQVLEALGRKARRRY